MRNLARKGSQTSYVFLSDIDVIPSINATEQLSKFLRTNKCVRCAFVVPTYEVAKTVKFPRDKARLKELVAAGRARPFHSKVFPPGHHATNFTE